MKTIITTLAILLPVTASAQTQQHNVWQGFQPQPSLVLPMPVPAMPSGQGYAIIERDRPAPLYYPSDTYHSIKVVPLDPEGRPTQPTYTMQDLTEDLIYGNLQKNKDKNW